jgi:hypothetical protein
MNGPIDAPPNSLTDSNANLNVKIMEEGIGICSLAYSTLGVRRACWSFEMGTKTSDKWVNYSHIYVQTKQQVG